MKFATSIILSALLAFACGLYLPWWSIALATFTVSAALDQKPVASFLSGFIGVFVLWLMLTININSSNEAVLAPKISSIMGFGNSSFTLILITAVLGAIVSGLGALTGSLFIRMMRRKTV